MVYSCPTCQKNFKKDKQAFVAHKRRGGCLPPSPPSNLLEILMNKRWVVQEYKPPQLLNPLSYEEWSASKLYREVTRSEVMGRRQVMIRSQHPSYRQGQILAATTKYMDQNFPFPLRSRTHRQDQNLYNNYIFYLKEIEKRVASQNRHIDHPQQASDYDDPPFYPKSDHPLQIVFFSPTAYRVHFRQNFHDSALPGTTVETSGFAGRTDYQRHILEYPPPMLKVHDQLQTQFRIWRFDGDLSRQIHGLELPVPFFAGIHQGIYTLRWHKVCFNLQCYRSKVYYLLKSTQFGNPHFIPEQGPAMCPACPRGAKKNQWLTQQALMIKEAQQELEAHVRLARNLAPRNQQGDSSSLEVFSQAESETKQLTKKKKIHKRK